MGTSAMQNKAVASFCCSEVALRKPTRNLRAVKPMSDLGEGKPEAKLTVHIRHGWTQKTQRLLVKPPQMQSRPRQSLSPLVPFVILGFLGFVCRVQALVWKYGLRDLGLVGILFKQVLRSRCARARESRHVQLLTRF